LAATGRVTSLAEAEPRLVTIFLILSALMNIGLGYWLATYLAREKARASGFDMQADVPADAAIEAPAEPGQLVRSALPAEMPTAAPEMPIMAQPMATAAAMPAALAAVEVAPALVAVDAPAVPEMGAAAAAPELETEVLAGIEEFRNQLAQMKATPGAVEPLAASV
jgi:hypothetical protein